MSASTDGFGIRRAAPQDASQCAPLLADVGYPMPPEGIADRLTRLTPPDDHVFIAEVAGRILGIATLHLTPALHRAAPVGRITLLVVAEDFRGTGIGRSLVDVCERETATAGGSIIEVISNLRYADSHDFYRRLGYELTSHKFKKVLRGG